MPWGAERANHWPDNLGGRRTARASRWRSPRSRASAPSFATWLRQTRAFPRAGGRRRRSRGAPRSLVVNGTWSCAAPAAPRAPTRRAASRATSLRDYVTLPADARVAVALEAHGDAATGAGAQGFLELRKL